MWAPHATRDFGAKRNVTGATHPPSIRGCRNVTRSGEKTRRETYLLTILYTVFVQQHRWNNTNSKAVLFLRFAACGRSAHSSGNGMVWHVVRQPAGSVTSFKRYAKREVFRSCLHGGAHRLKLHGHHRPRTTATLRRECLCCDTIVRRKTERAASAYARRDEHRERRRRRKDEQIKY